MLSKTQLSPDAEEIIIHLHRTQQQIERTRQAIRERCQLGKRLDSALHEVMQAGYVDDVDGEYQLTPSGKQYARMLGTAEHTQIINHIERMEGGTVTMAGVHESGSRQIDHKSLYTAPLESMMDALPDTDEAEHTRHAPPTLIPSLYYHPLRRSSVVLENPPDRRPVVVLRYMLVFEMPKDALPIPILHHDILGRSRTADICLYHDDFISARHCRFEVRRDGNDTKLFVEDIGSRNGTFIDHVQLQQHRPKQLRHGAHLQVGNTMFTVVQIP